MLSDFQKIRILIDKNLFTSEYQKINKIAEDISKKVINHVIKDFKQELLALDINVDFDDYSGAGTGQENWESYFNDLNIQLKPYRKRLDLNKLRLTSLYKDYFGTSGKNIFSYMNQITVKSGNTHIKFIDLDSPFYAKCRKAISLLTNVPIDILKLKDQALFCKKLDDFIEEKIQLEEKDNTFAQNKFFIIKEFEIFRLKYLLELNDEIHHKIGLQQMLRFPKLIPSFFEKSTVDNNNLFKHIFMEGYHGTGKTTVAQQVAIAVSKENSFYINLSEIKEDILTEDEETKIKKFLETIQYLKGVLILDNINCSAYAKLFTRTCLKIADEINLKMIFISTLEQHNTLKNLQTFTELFHENWEEIKQQNLYIEISSTKTAKNYRLKFLDNLITNYSSIIGKEMDFVPTNKSLRYLDNEFNGMIYLIKIALDSQNVTSLEQLKVKKAKELIVTQYKSLIEHENIELIYLCAYGIYLRVEEDLYHDQYLLEHHEINELFERKHLYIVKDTHFNKNMVIYFPNQLIPIQLVEYMDQKNKSLFNIFASKKSILELDALSKNNTMNILRYLILRRDVQYFYSMVEPILDPVSFNINSEHKINLYELNLLVATFVKHDFINIKTLSFSKQQLRLLQTLKDILFANGNDEYMIFLMLNTNLHIIKDWIIMLSRVIKNYGIVKLKNKNDKYIQTQYIELLKYFLRRTLKIITYPKYSQKIHSSERFLETIIDTMKRYSLEEVFADELKKIHRLSAKVAISS